MGPQKAFWELLQSCVAARVLRLDAQGSIFMRLTSQISSCKSQWISLKHNILNCTAACQDWNPRFPRHNRTQRAKISLFCWQTWLSQVMLDCSTNILFYSRRQMVLIARSQIACRGNAPKNVEAYLASLLSSSCVRNNCGLKPFASKILIFASVAVSHSDLGPRSSTIISESFGLLSIVKPAESLKFNCLALYSPSRSTT